MKMKLSPVKFSLVAVLLLLGITSSAQVLTSAVEDINYGSFTKTGSVLKYTYTVTNDKADPFSLLYLFDRMPDGTTYVANSTKVNGVAWGDINGGAPTVASKWNNQIYVPLPNGAGVLLPGETATITYQVTVNDTAGSIWQFSTIFNVNFNADQSYSAGFPDVTIPIVNNISYSLADPKRLFQKK